MSDHGAQLIGPYPRSSTFPVGGGGGPGKTHDFRLLTNSFHMSEALGSSNIENVLTENRNRNLRGERRAL